MPLQNKPLIIAHRGASAYLPENTMKAFRLAIEHHGVQMTEFDLHLSKDNIPVIIHDETLERTTNGTGLVSDKTLNELQKLDAGYYFKIEGSAGFPCRSKGIKIPTFEELLKSFPKHPLAVEIKQKSRLLVHRAIELIKQYHHLDLCIVGSKHHLVSKIMREKYPHIRRFCSERDVISLIAASKTSVLKNDSYEMTTASIPPYCNGINLDSKDWMDFLHRKKMTVFYWTINDADSAKRLAGNGADGIITNDAPLIQKALRS